RHSWLSSVSPVSKLHDVLSTASVAATCPISRTACMATYFVGLSIANGAGLGYSQCYANVQRHLRAVRQPAAPASIEERVVAGRTGLSCRNGRELPERNRERKERTDTDKDHGTRSGFGHQRLEISSRVIGIRTV